MSNVPQSGTRIVAGGLNFRDMGGYAAADGRTVRWNCLYRSGTTHDMTTEELRVLAAKGIRYAHDLRSNAERELHPNRLSGLAGVEYWCRNHDQLSGDLVRLMGQPNVQAEQGREAMLTLYRDLPYDFRDAYRELFMSLADGRLPLVFNCSAGKDRTGVAAALVLTALGVPRVSIVEDYLLTEQCYEQLCQMLIRRDGTEGLTNPASAIWESMLRADAAYLGAMFEQLEAAHGTAERYLSDELGVDTLVIERLRGHLLESA